MNSEKNQLSVELIVQKFEENLKLIELCKVLTPLLHNLEMKTELENLIPNWEEALSNISNRRM